MTPVTMLSTKVRNADRSIGAILIDAGRLTPQDAERIINFQKQSDLRFGEAGIELGLISEGDVLYALSLQFDYPYLQPGPNKPISPEVVAAYKPFSPEGEGLRALRSQLQLRWFDAKGANTSLAIVGASRGEGRSYLAANLAVTFAQLGERTLLIDADMRTPRQHKLFKIENQTGLSNLLVGDCKPSEAVRKTNVQNLALLPAGMIPPNPAELLGSKRCAEYFSTLSEHFDWVVIDSPPVLAVADQAKRALAEQTREERQCMAKRVRGERLKEALSTLADKVRHLATRIDLSVSQRRQLVFDIAHADRA